MPHQFMNTNTTFHHWLSEVKTSLLSQKSDPYALRHAYYELQTGRSELLEFENMVRDIGAKMVWLFSPRWAYGKACAHIFW